MIFLIFNYCHKLSIGFKSELIECYVAILCDLFQAGQLCPWTCVTVGTVLCHCWNCFVSLLEDSPWFNRKLLENVCMSFQLLQTAGCESHPKHDRFTFMFMLVQLFRQGDLFIHMPRHCARKVLSLFCNSKVLVPRSCLIYPSGLQRISTELQYDRVREAEFTEDDDRASNFRSVIAWFVRLHTLVLCAM